MQASYHPSQTHGSNVNGMTREEAYWTGWWNRVRRDIRQEAAGMTIRQVEAREKQARAALDKALGTDEENEASVRYDEWYRIGYAMAPDLAGCGGMKRYDPAKDEMPL